MLLKQIPSMLFFFVLLFLAMTIDYSLAQEKFGGIGLEVAQLFDPSTKDNKGSLVVLHVIEGSPAYKAGIQEGDIITHIDEDPTKGKNFEDVILSKLRGTVDSIVTLTIKKTGIKEPLRFHLKREEITFPGTTK